MSVGRVCCIVLICAVVAGCGFGIPLKKTTLVMHQAERSVTIRANGTLHCYSIECTLPLLCRAKPVWTLRASSTM